MLDERIIRRLEKILREDIDLSHLKRELLELVLLVERLQDE